MGALKQHLKPPDTKVGAFMVKICQNREMCRFFTILLSFAIALPAGAAGLGFNPFDKNSPTSPGGSQKASPTSPSSANTPKPPAPVVAPNSATPPPNYPAPQQTKK